MKHVFIIHSSITYIASLSIIAEEKISEADVLILCLKDMSFDEIIPVVYIPREKKLNSKTMGVRKLRDFVNNRFNSEDYCLYTPVMNLVSKMLVTSTKCKKLCFFEEGTEAYITSYNLDYIACEYHQQKNWTLDSLRDYKNLLSRVVGLFLRGVSLKLISLPFHYIEYASIKGVVFYCLSEKTFPLAKNKKLIRIHNGYTDKLKSHINLNNKCIWVSSEFFKESFRPFIKKHYQLKLTEYFEKNNIKEIFIKFHQGESDYSRDITRKMFEEIGIGYTVLDDSTMLEIELINSQNVTMLGDFSSLLMYNTIFGHTSISVIKGIGDSSENLEGFSVEKYNNFMKDFEEIIYI